MEIKRDRYLQELIDRKGNGLIKIVTGIRRSGKSYLLFTIFYNHLLASGIEEDHIITMDMDDLENKPYRDPLTLLHYIKSKITDTKQYYVLLDEVQLINNFPELLNSLLHIRNTDVYVTASYSKFLSKDVITEFRGRGDEVHLYPLSFAEFMTAYDGDRYHGWDEYYRFGGLPGVFLRKTEPQKSDYLQTLFTETYLIDILERNAIQNTPVIETLIDILSSSIGSLTNPQRITNTFSSVLQTPVSVNTVKKYIDALEDAFIITGVKRYDIRGRKYIGTPLKYYFEDVGLRNARLNFRRQEGNYIMENIIYNELRVRGFHVDVGVVEVHEPDATGKYVHKKLEIDFVANRASQKYYIQSAFTLAGDEKEKQEKRPFQRVDDSFKKIVVTKDYVMKKHDEDGILTIGIIDFLLNEDSMDA